jgi:hypothetical protein
VPNGPKGPRSAPGASNPEVGEGTPAATLGTRFDFWILSENSEIHIASEGMLRNMFQQ